MRRCLTGECCEQVEDVRCSVVNMSMSKVSRPDYRQLQIIRYGGVKGAECNDQMRIVDWIVLNRRS